MEFGGVEHVAGYRTMAAEAGGVQQHHISCTVRSSLLAVPYSGCRSWRCTAAPHLLYISEDKSGTVY